MKKYLLFLTASLTLTISHGQITFQKTYGSTSYEGVQCLASLGDGCIKQLDDGGYIMCGSTYDSIYGRSNLFVTKLNNIGDTLFTKIFSKSQSSVLGNYIDQTTDGGYIVAGQAQSIWGNNNFLIKLNSNGDTLWTRSFMLSSNNTMCQTACIADDGNYILAINAPYYSFALVKINNSGNILWCKKYSSASIDMILHITKTAQGQFLLTGYGNYNDASIIKTDSLGNILWARRFTNRQGLVEAVELSDKSIIAVGHSNYNAFLIKTDSTGNLKWLKYYDKQNYTRANTLKVTSDNNIIFGAQRCIDGPPSPCAGSNILMTKCDTSGNILWSKSYGGYGMEYPHAIINTSDNGFMISGYTESFGSGSQDLYLIKTDSDGNVPCNSQNVSITDTLVTPSIVIPQYNAVSGITVLYFPVTKKQGLKTTTSCSTAGINNFQNTNLQISVFPNPFSTQTTLQTDKFLKNASLTVYNSFGQAVKRIDNLAGQTIIFHRDNLPSGLYFVQLTQDGNTITADKFVITEK